MNDEDELYQLALAAYMLGTPMSDVSINRLAMGGWRRACIDRDWAKRLPLYLWITVKVT